ncbi:MAG: F0F1 ATP synthase subunit delta [Gemmatimonadetes bacterium]|nr:F0F1 ATP synthase subunit delta [Gemmatimonadota bacterium]
MRDSTIARNYAEALLELARKANDLEGWGARLDALAGAIKADLTLRRFLDSPKVDVATKSAVLGKALAGSYPATFVRFVQAITRRGRQVLIPEIAIEYALLVDEAVGRVHASVTLARPADAAEQARIAAALSASLGKTVVPHVVVDPAILGGAIVRVGDRVRDGSVKRRLALLRQRMVHGAR